MSVTRPSSLIPSSSCNPLLFPATLVSASIRVFFHRGVPALSWVGATRRRVGATLELGLSSHLASDLASSHYSDGLTGLPELSVDDLPVFESQKIQCLALHRIDEPVWRNVDGTFALQGES